MKVDLTFDEAEGTLNEGLGCMHKLIAEITTATSAMSNGNGHRRDRRANMNMWPREVGEKTGR